MRFLLQREPQTSEIRRTKSRPSTRSTRGQSFLADFPHHAGKQAIPCLFRSGLVQPSLAVGTIDDPAEHEADAIAAQITSGETPDRAHNAAIDTGRSAAGPSSAHAPGIVEQVLHSSGKPLDSAIRSTFESRFGRNFSHVRVHIGTEAAASARSINARAYTAGSDIVFGAGQFSPQTLLGQRLLAHELTHVIQQDSSMHRGTNGEHLVTSRADGTIHRQPVGQLTIPTGTIKGTPEDEKKWRLQVDAGVRSLFGLDKSGLTASNVQFLDLPDFAAAYPSGSIADRLFYIFWSVGQADPSSVPGLILQINTGRSFELPPLHGYDAEEIREVVRQGLKDGFFWYHTLPTIDIHGSQKITPRDLIAEYTGGVTTITGSRPSRRIKIRRVGGESSVKTLVHEACHFYVSNAFRDAVEKRKDGNELIGGAMISKILFEGFAEHFAQQVMEANPDFGPDVGTYRNEVKQVWRLVETLGEDSVRKAYFKGDKGEIKNLMATVDRYKKTHPDLLIP